VVFELQLITQTPRSMMILSFAGPDLIVYRRKTRAASGLISSPYYYCAVVALVRYFRLRLRGARRAGTASIVNKITYANSLVIYIGYAANFAEPMEIKTMGISQPNIFRSVQSRVRSHDVTILFGYAAFLFLLIAIYYDSITPGIAPGDLASMTVFP
jgi:hypothetical protein